MQRPFTPGNDSASLLAQGLIANRLYNHPEGRVMYRDRLRTLFERVWDEAALLAEVDRIQQLTDASEAAIAAQKRFIVSHGQAIQAELEMPPPEWINGPSVGPSVCRSEVRTEARGSFATTWSVGSTSGQEQALDITLNMAPWMPDQMLVSSGINQFDRDAAQIRYVTPQPDGTLIVVALSVPFALFTVGEHTMHGFETCGVVGRFNPQNPSGVEIVAVIGAGTIRLDEATTEAGGAVSGSFEGTLLQIRPL